MYSVYAKKNKQDKVEKIYSDCFEVYEDGDVLIKQGQGDEFVHVNGKYHIFDSNGCHNYKIKDGKLEECTYEDKKDELAKKEMAPTIQELKQEIDSHTERMAELQQMIADIMLAGTEGE